MANAFAALLLVAAQVAAPAATGSPSQTTAADTGKISKFRQAQLEALKISAPADEYFGRLKMSYLGINNTLRDASITAGDHTTEPRVVGKVSDAVDALHAWSQKYPRDPQLARSYFLAVQVDRKIWLKENQDRAWTFMNRIVQAYPGSYFAKALKASLAIGFTEHYYADPVPCATPTPTPNPGTALLLAPAYAVPSPTPSPSPSPTPTPSPTPMKPGGPKVQIETPACVPPATASPSPSPSPSPTAAPATTPEAAPSSSPTAAGSPVPAATPSPRS